MSKQFILVVYDISNDRRRTKLHNVLLNYGTPVQYSVFECLLEAGQFERMKKEIRRLIRPQKDNLRYYWLCAECRAKVETTGGVEVLSETPPAIIA